MKTINMVEARSTIDKICIFVDQYQKLSEANVLANKAMLEMLKVVMKSYLELLQHIEDGAANEKSN